MRIATVLTVAALWLGPLVGLGTAAVPVAKPAPKAETCGDYGTSVLFEETPQEAAKKALKEEKLVFVLHVSGHFEDPAMT